VTPVRAGRTVLESGWTLTGTDGAGRPLRLVFGETELARAYLGLTVGRHPDLNDQTIADAGVSRRHLRLALADGTLVVEDLNSLNGTLIDETPIAAFRQVAISPGQTLTLGRIRLTLSRPGEGTAP
jgi:pSer/pThr/pTyr-binding forkhead associated (FHA) protein